MPFFAKTQTIESTVSNSLFWLLPPCRTFTRESRATDTSAASTSQLELNGGVISHMREELPSGVDSMPLAMYAFMSGYVGWRFSNKFMPHAHSLVAQCRLFHHLHYLVRLYDR